MLLAGSRSAHRSCSGTQADGAATVSDAASCLNKACSQAHASSETFHLEVTNVTFH